jgi:hypothetical protein
VVSPGWLAAGEGSCDRGTRLSAGSSLSAGAIRKRPESTHC